MHTSVTSRPLQRLKGSVFARAHCADFAEGHGLAADCPALVIAGQQVRLYRATESVDGCTVSHQRHHCSSTTQVISKLKDYPQPCRDGHINTPNQECYLTFSQRVLEQNAELCLRLVQQVMSDRPRGAVLEVVSNHFNKLLCRQL